MFKQEKGITLVSLVITIIVMLILAGVSMSMVMGDGSVLDQAQAAVENTELANVRDEISMAVAGAQTNYYATFANTSGRSSLAKELRNLKMKEFTSAEEVWVDGVAEAATTVTGGKIYYKLDSSDVWYVATIDIGTSGINVKNVQNAHDVDSTNFNDDGTLKAASFPLTADTDTVKLAD